MPKFVVDYAFEVTCRGRVEIEADDLDHAHRKAEALLNANELIDGWDYKPEEGMMDERIVMVSPEEEQA